MSGRPCGIFVTLARHRATSGVLLTVTSRVSPNKAYTALIQYHLPTGAEEKGV
jgi:hypothetical protein